MDPQSGALTEAFSRRQGQGAGQPMQQQMGQPPAAEQGLPQSMSQGGIDQLQKSAPGEAEIIIKALIQRLKSLGERGE